MQPKHTVCNTSCVSQLIKPLNVSKPVYSSKATKCNVCNASSVSQLTNPSNVSKSICSSKATKRNVCNTSSVCKRIKSLVKLFVPIIQMDVMSVKSLVVVNSSNHLILLNLFVPVMQVILSFAIPLVRLSLTLLVMVGQLTLKRLGDQFDPFDILL